VDEEETRLANTIKRVDVIKLATRAAVINTAGKWDEAESLALSSSREVSFISFTILALC
jgi:hypothetical protein